MSIGTFFKILEILQLIFFVFPMFLVAIFVMNADATEILRFLVISGMIVWFMHIYKKSKSEAKRRNAMDSYRPGA